MSNTEIGTICFALLILLISTHLIGDLFARLRQPRVIGEIVAGLLIGPSVLGRVAHHWTARLFDGVATGAGRQGAVLGFIYSLGLLLLMFLSGTETRRLFARRDRRQTALLAIFGTGLPFAMVVAASPWLPLQQFMGAANNRLSVLLVLGIAVAVTSIPVISRIFHDLQILHTRFASLILGVAVIEDIALWSVLAVAEALAASGVLPRTAIVRHVAVSLAYFALGMTAGPALLKRLQTARWNVLARSSPVGYAIGVLLAYSAVAAACDVSLVFAAFLAGYALTSEAQAVYVASALDSISKFSFATFIPIYFAIVGYKLDLGKSFSLTMLGVFLVLACGLKILSVAVGARLGGFALLDTINLAIATNARGGPGIVLASVAFDAHIINAAAFTTLVLLAIITSQAAGAWLEFVLRRGWPLLSPEAGARKAEAGSPAEEAAA